jgi:hypothetical protein
MQTVSGTTTRQREKTARPRRQHERGYVEPLIAVGFAAVYLWLASAMEGLNFDTIFIALFCTLLSVFVVRCFRAWLTGR